MGCTVPVSFLQVPCLLDPLGMSYKKLLVLRRHTTYEFRSVIVPPAAECVGLWCFLAVHPHVQNSCWLPLVL